MHREYSHTKMNLVVLCHSNQFDIKCRILTLMICKRMEYKVEEFQRILGTVYKTSDGHIHCQFKIME